VDLEATARDGLDDEVFAVFEGELREVLRTVPYNSAAQFVDIFGDGERSPRLGAACVFQTLEVARRVEERTGIPARLIPDGRHLAAIFEYEGGLVLLDPYLLHTTPIHIEARTVRAGSGRVVSTAAPVRTDSRGVVRPGRLTARYRTYGGGWVVRLEYSKFSPTRGRYLLSRLFTLRSEDAFGRPDGRLRVEALPREFLTSILTDPEQTSLSIRALDDSLEHTSEVILPLHGYAGRNFSAGDLWLRDSAGVAYPPADPAAAPVWDELVASTGLASTDLVDHLLCAADIYRSVADPDGDVQPYSFESE